MFIIKKFIRVGYFFAKFWSRKPGFGDRKHLYKVIDITNRYVGSVYTDINFLKDLILGQPGNGDINNGNKRQYTPLYYALLPARAGHPDSTYLNSNRTSVVNNDYNQRKFQQDYILNYKKSIGEHNFTATAGFTTYYFGEFNTQITTRQGSSLSDHNSK